VGSREKGGSADYLSVHSAWIGTVVDDSHVHRRFILAWERSVLMFGKRQIESNTEGASESPKEG